MGYMTTLVKMIIFVCFVFFVNHEDIIRRLDFVLNIMAHRFLFSKIHILSFMYLLELLKLIYFVGC